MYLRSRIAKFALPALLSVLAIDVATASGVVIGMGAEADTVDGRAYSFFTDIGITDDTWLSGAVARTQTDNSVFNLDTTFADVSLDHFFGPVGIRLGASYWGDDDLLRSKDGHVSIYVRGKHGSLSADYERRNFDLTINSDLLAAPRTVEFGANGYGLTGRWQASEKTSLYLGGMTYDYSRNIALQPETDNLRFLALSRFSLMNSLIDYRVSGGIEFKLGQSRLDFRYAGWRTAVVKTDVGSLDLGFITPIGNSSDIEFRLAVDDADGFDRATVFSVFFYLYSE